jgi:ankyrin repeat protein
MTTDTPSPVSPDSAPDQETIDRFVGMCHFNLDGAQAALAEQPDLLHRRSSVAELPIEAAAHVGNRPIMEWLLEQGAEKALCTMAALGERDEVLAALDADPTRKTESGGHGMGLVLHAIVGGDDDLVRGMVERGVPVNTTAAGASADPLHMAVMRQNEGFVALLLEHDADPSAKNFQGKTPLEIAHDNELAAIIALLEAKA